MVRKTGRLRVLERLEAGELDFEQALAELGTSTADDQGGRTEEEPAAGNPEVRDAIPEQPRSGANKSLGTGTMRSSGTGWRSWWLIPFTAGLVVSAAGIWLAGNGGWWWLVAGPALVVGVPLTLLSLASAQAPWIHIRIRNQSGSRLKAFGISLPIPARPAAWLLRLLRPLIPGLDDTAVDELVIALEQLGPDSPPLRVEVDEGPDGESIEVYLG